MKRFIAGKVIELQGEPGMYSELKVLLETGQAVPVFYGHPPTAKMEDDMIGPLLSLSSFYEFLLIVKIRDFTYTPTFPEGTVLKLVPKVFPADGDIPSFTRNNIRQGKIVDPDWSPDGLSYLGIATPKILENRYVLVEIAIGQAVISHKAIRDQLGEQASEIVTGGYLEFSTARLDILAILSKDEE